MPLEGETVYLQMKNYHLTWCAGEIQWVYVCEKEKLTSGMVRLFISVFDHWGLDWE